MRSESSKKSQSSTKKNGKKEGTPVSPMLSRGRQRRGETGRCENLDAQITTEKKERTRKKIRGEEIASTTPKEHAQPVETNKTGDPR
jgi:hypothetical protein